MDSKVTQIELERPPAHDAARRFIDLLLGLSHDDDTRSQLVINRDKGQTTVDFRFLCTSPSAPAAIERDAPQIADVLGVALVRGPGESGYRVERIDAQGNPAPALERAYFERHPVFGGIAPARLDGQHMISVPRFYVRWKVLGSGPFAGSPAWFMSAEPHAGFRVHGGFVSANHPQGAPYFMVGAYQGSMDGATLASVPGALPATRMDLDQFIHAAALRNAPGETGWGIWSAQQAAAIDWLYLIEYASFDCQAAIAPGRVDAEGVGQVDEPDVIQAAYRGITGLWGNVWQWVDGLKIVDGVIHVADPTDPGQWINTGTRPPQGGWHPTSFIAPELVGDIFIAASLAADEEDGITANIHYYDTSKGEYFPYRGGYWSRAGHAGVFALYLNAPRSNAPSSIGSRPAFVL